MHVHVLPIFWFQSLNFLYTVLFYNSQQTFYMYTNKQKIIGAN